MKLVMFPYLVSLLPLALLLLFFPGRYSGTKIEDLLISSMVFLWGLSGIPIMIRRELPYLISIRGWYAVATGLMIACSFWGLLIARLIGLK
jgi:hypothetical protein